MNDILPIAESPLTLEHIERIIFLLQSISGALIEITWIAKAFFVMFIIFSAWRLVRK